MCPFWGGFGWFGGFFGLLFWVVIIGLIVWLIVRGSRGDFHRPYKSSNTDALDIARERYARGEIDEAEFNKIKQNLS